MGIYRSIIAIFGIGIFATLMTIGRMAVKDALLASDDQRQVSVLAPPSVAEEPSRSIIEQAKGRIPASSPVSEGGQRLEPLAYKIHIAPKGKRNQIRAVVAKYPKTVAVWQEMATKLAKEVGGPCLVTFVDVDDLAAWKGTSDVDLAHYLCRCRCDQGQPIVFQKNPDRDDVVREFR